VHAGRPWPGSPTPLGATWDGEGTNFAVHTASAEDVDLCLFDDAGLEVPVPLELTSGHVLHAYQHLGGPGQRHDA
jgi:glycogen operon protein